MRMVHSYNAYGGGVGRTKEKELGEDEEMESDQGLELGYHDKALRGLPPIESSAGRKRKGVPRKGTLVARNAPSRFMSLLTGSPTGTQETILVSLLPFLVDSNSSQMAQTRLRSCATATRGHAHYTG